jgi:hypothetical protein
MAVAAAGTAAEAAGMAAAWDTATDSYDAEPRVAVV